MGGRLRLALLAGGIAILAWLAARGRPAESERIGADDLRAHVAFLASDDLMGRDTGEPGVARAEEYVAAQFARAGLRPLPGRESFFLEFTLYRTGYDLAATSLAVTAGGEVRPAAPGVDFRPFPFSAEGSAEAEVVFAGYGITAPEHGYDDYEALDAAGKIVLVLRHEPGENDERSPFDGVESSEHALFETKVQNARAHGAAAMLLATDPLHHGTGDDLRLGGGLRLEKPGEEADRGGPRPRRGTERGAVDRGRGAPATESAERLLAVQVSRELAGAIVAPSGAALDDLQRSVEGGTRPADLPLGGVRARVAIRRSDDVEPVAARNVAAFLEGSDPGLRDAWIVVGGHHDHVGGWTGPGDTVFNGADDNASGTSAVIELARAFAGRREPPRRSLVFVTFTGEEKGLLGSRAMVAKDMIALDRVVFMINLDMIGRNPDRPVDVYGDGFARGFREIVEAANAPERLALHFGGTDYVGASDHDAFYRVDVPFAFFFTGTHEDYHQVGDHQDKLAIDRMASIVRLAYRTVESLAGADRTPSFIPGVSWLGARVEVLESADGARAATVVGIDSGSRAEKAGLREGDVLRAVGDRTLDDPDAVGKRFREIEPGDRAALRLDRGGTDLTVEVERARPGYLGVLPAPPDEDARRAHGLSADEGVVLRRVFPGAPAAAAGLADGDLVVRIEGRPVGAGSLASRLAQIGAGETVRVALIRGAERLDLPVTLGERPAERP